MKPSLIFLPFIALIVAAIGAATGAALPSLPWLAYACYVASIILLFIWVKLDLQNFRRIFSRKGAKYGASSGLVVLIGLAVIVGLAVLSNRARFNKSFDLTQGGVNTLSDQSLKIADTTKGLAAPVQIKAFFDNGEAEGSFRDLLKLYQSAGANLVVEYIDPNLQPEKAMAEKLSATNTVIIRNANQESRLTTFNEEKITNALVNVLKQSSKTIYFTTGHGEGSIESQEVEGLSVAVQELKNNKYEVKELPLLVDGVIPKDANLIVIAGPQYEFKDQELNLIDGYLQSGGALLVMLDALAPVKGLSELLANYGIGVQNDLVIFRPGDPRAGLYGTANALVTEFDEFNAITKDFARESAVALIMPKARTFSEVTTNKNEARVSLVAKTSADAARVKDVYSENDLNDLSDSRIEMGSFPVIASSIAQAKAPKIAENKTSEDTTVKADANQSIEMPDTTKEIRIVAIGSGQLASNQLIVAKEHLDMFINTNNFLLQDEDFISIRPKDATKSELNLMTDGAQLSFLMISFLFPFAFLGFGVWIWMRRRSA